MAVVGECGNNENDNYMSTTTDKQNADMIRFHVKALNHYIDQLSLDVEVSVDVFDSTILKKTIQVYLKKRL